MPPPTTRRRGRCSWPAAASRVTARLGVPVAASDAIRQIRCRGCRAAPVRCLASAGDISSARLIIDPCWVKSFATISGLLRINSAELFQATQRPGRISPAEELQVWMALPSWGRSIWCDVTRCRAFRAGWALLMLCPLHGRASESVYLTPSADTALLAAFPTHNFGGQTYFNAGTTQNYTKNRGLLKFDVAGELPPHAKIVSASLTLDVQHTPSDGDTP